MLFPSLIFRRFPYCWQANFCPAGLFVSRLSPIGCHSRSCEIKQAATAKSGEKKTTPDPFAAHFLSVLARVSSVSPAPFPVHNASTLPRARPTPVPLKCAPPASRRGTASRRPGRRRPAPAPAPAPAARRPRCRRPTRRWVLSRAGAGRKGARRQRRRPQAARRRNWPTWSCCRSSTSR